MKYLLVINVYTKYVSLSRKFAARVRIIVFEYEKEKKYDNFLIYRL